MKKFLSVLAALALCAALMVPAFAAEEIVNPEAAQEIVDGIVGIINNEGTDADIEQAAKDLTAALENVVATTDVSALAEQLKNYATGADVDASALFNDLGAVEDLLKKFLEDGGINTEDLEKDLQNPDSALGKLVQAGAHYYDVPTTPSEPAPTTPAEDVENPETGDSATGIVAALGALAFSASAAVIFLKKKDDNED